MARAGSHRVSWSVAGGLVAVAVAVAIVLWLREAAVAPPSLAGAGGRTAAGAATAAASGKGAAKSAMATPPVAGDRVPQATTGGSVALRGTVRIAGTHTPVSAGSVVAQFVDCAAEGMEPQSLVDRPVEELPDHERDGALGADGTYAIELPDRAFLVRIRIEPPKGIDVPGVIGEVRFDAFERLEVVVREAVAGPEWRRDFEVERGRTLTGFV